MVGRLSVLYAAIFALIGIMLPYWPVWLDARGLGPGEIGLITGAAMWSKVLINPLAGQAADSLGRLRPVMALLAGVSLALFLILARKETTGFWPIFLLSLPATGLFAALLPLAETVTVRLSVTQGFAYGRVRLWGSISFIACVALGGPLIEHLGAAVVPLLLAGSLALILIWLPRVPEPPRVTQAEPGGLRRLVTNRRLVALLVAVGLIQAGHATYYGFGTLHWQRAGLDGLTIGLLWAEGVVAEIVLFWFSGHLAGRISPVGLIALGALAGVVRWPLTAMTTDPAWLAVTQLLHAGTYGCTHLGAMAALAASVPPGLAARAQGLYSSLCMGAMIGLAVTAAGPLYTAWGGGAFGVDALWCALGGLVLLRLPAARPTAKA